MQSKQFTHLERSTSFFIKSIQEDLQETAHLPHFIHFDLSNLTLKIEILAIRPKKVPTGQTVLQYNLPFINDIMPIRRKNSPGTIYVGKGNPVNLILATL
jgi:hypothetical protein